MYKIGIARKLFGFDTFKKYKVSNHYVTSVCAAFNADGVAVPVEVPLRLVMTLKNGATVIVESIASKTWKIYS